MVKLICINCNKKKVKITSEEIKKWEEKSSEVLSMQDWVLTPSITMDGKYPYKVVETATCEDCGYSVWREKMKWRTK